MGNTIVPRPAVEPQVDIVFVLENDRKLDTRQQGILESKINDEYLEPDELGQLEHVFRVEVTQNDFQSDRIALITTANMISEDEIEDLKDVVETTIGVFVESWDIIPQIRRSSMPFDAA